MSERNLSPLDQLICSFDRALRSVTRGTQTTNRATPTPSNDYQEDLNESERLLAAGLMRVNHSGEVCAQALYQGQALTAKLPNVREDMENAADEEIDHLAWCEQRLEDLDAQPSVFNPLWYGLSFGIGASAGIISDKVSLGFVAATEQLVCKHLNKHLTTLPANDYNSKAIVKQMLADEEKHGHMAIKAGGYQFPGLIKASMSAVSKVMTTLSYRW